jgi:hypothetical protein
MRVVIGGVALLWLTFAVMMTWQAGPLTSSELESRKAMANQLIAGIKKKIQKFSIIF